MKNTDHVLIDEHSGGAIHCAHCQECHAPPLPMKAIEYADRLLGFVRMHRACPAPDKPSPQEKLPHVEPPDLFGKMYPMASTAAQLRDQLHRVLPAEQYGKLPNGTVEAWPPASVPFQYVAHWARIECAHRDGETQRQRGEPGVPGLTVPRQTPMPEPLVQLLGMPPQKKQIGRAHV